MLGLSIWLEYRIEDRSIHVRCGGEIQRQPKETDFGKQIIICDPQNGRQQIDKGHGDGSGQVADAQQQGIAQRLRHIVAELADPGKGKACGQYGQGCNAYE